jgi:CheY-like chemotaxis protein
MDLGHADAGIALATAYASEISALRGLGSDMEDALNGQIAYCLTLGNAQLEAALVNAVAENKVGASIALVGLLASTGSADAVQFALENSGSTQLRFNAALALGGAGEINDAVVGALAEAASLDALRVVHIIDPNAERASKLTGALAKQGISVVRSEDGAGGMINAHRSVLVDAFIVANPLPDLYASRVIKELRKDARFSETPVLVFGAELEEMDGAEFVDDLSAEAVTAAFGDLGVDRERFLATAAAASSMLSHMSMVNSAAVAGAAAQMSGALGREDAVAIPAAGLIGRSGDVSQAAELMGLIADDSRSTEARTAAAKGLASMASRASFSMDTAGLISLIDDSEPMLAQACARAYAALAEAPLPSLGLSF